MKKVHIIWLIIAVAAFIGGMLYGKASVPSVPTGRFGGAGGAGGTFVRNGGGAGGAGGGFVAGRVVSKDAQSLTIALPNGSSEIVFYSSSTAVEKPMPATVNDIATGTAVLVAGTPNSDGSLTAQSIQVRSGNLPSGTQ